VGKEKELITKEEFYILCFVYPIRQWMLAVLLIFALIMNFGRETEKLSQVATVIAKINN
jgi:hypothetical protein